MTEWQSDEPGTASGSPAGPRASAAGSDRADPDPGSIPSAPGPVPGLQGIPAAKNPRERPGSCHPPGVKGGLA